MSVHEFKTQKKMQETEEMKTLPWTDEKTIPDIDDSEKYDWHEVGYSKYGRYMYCPKTKIKRGQTMGEFYGTGIVD